MPLHKLTDSELRQYCKEYIESLEMWLRRIIDDILTINYGSNYYNSTTIDGANIISKKIKKEIDDRISTEPSRYSRPIDACLLESEIKIITNPNLYQKHFRVVFDDFFIKGTSQMLRLILNRLTNPRNKLYHANAISVREAEQVICYSKDVIDSIKNYYIKINMSEEFNVPLILKYKDSFGNVTFRNKFTGKTIDHSSAISFKNIKEQKLRPGDYISIELEIDPSFSEDTYKVKWNPSTDPIQEGNTFKYKIRNKDIGEKFRISAKLITTNVWHKLNDFDDGLVISFVVLPPI